MRAYMVRSILPRPPRHNFLGQGRVTFAVNRSMIASRNVKFLDGEKQNTHYAPRNHPR